MRLVGTEVPIIGSDSVKWIDLALAPPHPPTPSATTASASATATATATVTAFAPPAEDYASSFLLGDPPSYLIERIHKSSPQALELLHLSPHDEFPSTGLRISFPSPLSPFAFFCPNEDDYGSRSPFLLYVVTVSGVAYLLYLDGISSYFYSSSSVLLASDFVELDLRTYVHRGRITSVAAIGGFLLLGTNEGSLVSLHFLREL